MQKNRKTEKKCTRCKKILPIDEFHFSGTSADKRKSKCKGCVKELSDIKRAKIMALGYQKSDKYDNDLYAIQECDMMTEWLKRKI